MSSSIVEVPQQSKEGSQVEASNGVKVIKLKNSNGPSSIFSLQACRLDGKSFSSLDKRRDNEISQTIHGATIMILNNSTNTKSKEASQLHLTDTTSVTY
ncbi:hypothetical protein GOBAR_AA13031 [Gossypium barbadense]|uniref:Uncharacterized protein n=1 Tax=Gossypium barbadense TaxID=3634 RepID=A0A2P5XWF8_GOSBA|nr:hypothetical protein GOBAR_AA13031 [Gossypium barbadense]